MDIEALDCFAKVAEAGSLSAAAKRHGLPKSTLSLKLRQLESDLGVPLFVRAGRTIELTDAGSELIRHARQILASCDDARSAMAEIRDEIAGTLRIGSTGEFGTAFEAQMLFAFRQQYPRVKIDLVFFSPSVLFNGDSLMNFDAIMSWDDAADRDGAGETLASTNFALFASPSYVARNGPPTQPSDLQSHKGILFRKPAGLQSWQLQRRDERHDVMPHSDFVANDYWMIKYFAVAGEGIAYLPHFFTRLECEREHLMRVLPGWMSDEKRISVRMTSHVAASRKTRAFVDFAARFFTDQYDFTGPIYYVDAIHNSTGERR